MENIIAFIFCSKIAICFLFAYSLLCFLFTLNNYYFVDCNVHYINNIFKLHQWQHFYKNSQNKNSYTYSIVFILLSIISNDNITSMFIKEISKPSKTESIIFGIITVYCFVMGVWYLIFQIRLHSYIDREYTREIPGSIARVIVAMRIKIPQYSLIFGLKLTDTYSNLVSVKNSFKGTLLNAFEVLEESFKNNKSTISVEPINNISQYIVYSWLLWEYQFVSPKKWRIEKDEFRMITEAFVCYLSFKEMLPVYARTSDKKQKKKERIFYYIRDKLCCRDLLKGYIPPRDPDKRQIIPCFSEVAEHTTDTKEN